MLQQGGYEYTQLDMQVTQQMFCIYVQCDMSF